MKNTDKWTIGLGVIGVAIAFMTLQATQKEGGTGGSGGLDIPFINPQGGAVSGLAPEIAPETVASFFDTSKKASYVAPAITEQSFPGQLGWSGISEYMTGSKASSYAPVTPTTTSGYNISPFVAFIPYPYKFVLSPFEITEIFSVPVSALLNKAKRKKERYTFGGQVFVGYSYEYEGRVIWGATAKIVEQLLEIWQAICQT